MSRRCSFLVPGDLSTRTGGYGYDRRIVEGLRALHWQVDVDSLGAGFPAPDAGALARAGSVARAQPDGALVIVDGLAFGVLPEMAEAHAARLRWIALVHHPLALETGLAPAQQRALRAAERRSLAVARRVIVTSPSTAGALAEFDVPSARIVVVEPGCDPAPLAGGSGSAALSLLCVASLTPRKGHALLVEALSGLRDRAWTLHCAGSGTLDPACAEALRRCIDRFGLADRVVLHGEQDEAGVARLYAQADAFVLPSFHEGYGMALAEALARGLPVVSTTAGAIPDTVPAAAGALVAPGDLPALRAALRRLIDDADWRACAAAGARAARAQLTTWERRTQQFAAALEAVGREPDR
jgi:glycosyltransferase involved in cell wall biosynthesis